MSADPIVIVSHARTPMGGFQGALAGASATHLGATAVRAAVQRAGVEPGRIDAAFMGCVLPAGLGQAPARQAALGAGLDQGCEATTVNKMCGSGMQAAIMAHDALLAGSARIVVAGGMESMTNSPYLLAKHRAGARIGHDRILDSMYLDGLEDAYEPGRLMGAFAEDTARAYQFTRDEMDAYAIESLRPGQTRPLRGGRVPPRRLSPVEISGRKRTHHNGSDDEQPLKADPVTHSVTLKPAFAKDGAITAANASSISDGAAALVLMRASTAEAPGAVAGSADRWPRRPRARAPGLFTTAPVPAMRKALAKRAGWSVGRHRSVRGQRGVRRGGDDRPCANSGIDRDAQLNVNGGACALGHPIGASGARVLSTLLAALEARGARRGLASLCIGGGEAVAMAVERL